MDKRELRILIVEDAPADAELCQLELKRAGLRFTAECVDTREEFERALREFTPDLILSDFSMPAFDGLTALDMTREKSPDIPFVFVSGTIGEDRAVEAMKRGATDYVLKDHLNRLGPVVQRALREREERAARRRIEGELEETRSRLDNIVSSLPDVVWSYSLRERRLLYVSPASNAIYGRSEASLYANPALWMDLIHPEDRERVERERRLSLAKHRLDSTYRVVLPGGQVRWMHDRATVVTDNSGELLRMDGLARDVTELKLQEQRIARLSRIHELMSGINSAIVRIRDGQELFQEACRVAVEHGKFAMAWIGLLDAATQVVTPVAKAGRHGGYLEQINLTVKENVPGYSILTAEALTRCVPVVCNDIATDERMSQSRAEALKRGYRSVALYPLMLEQRAVGVLVLYALEPEFFDEQEMKLLIEMAGDVSFALDVIKKEGKLNYLAYYDPLTGLPNRTLFCDRVNQFVQSHAERKERMAVATLDLERFAFINESLGRQGGDALLRLVAGRLQDAVGNIGGSARVSADTFAAILLQVRDASEIARVLEEKILDALGRPFTVEGQELRLSFKCGVALFPSDGADADTLLKNAEAALKKAKDSGDKYLFYAPQMNARVAEVLSLENKLRVAIIDEQFVLHYQPKVDVTSNRITGLEALIRWESPELGLVPPNDFVPLLEETGMILEIGWWVLKQAAADYRRWRKQGIEPPRIAVNISALQLRQKGFVDEVMKAIAHDENERIGLDLEITESVIMQDIEQYIPKLKVLRAMGIGIEIDDFGTGYSSLSYIAKLPVTALKIDRSFVDAMTHDDDSVMIVSTMISLAHSLNLQVVAEGVETEEQRGLLKMLKCDGMQGYLFSKPRAAADIETLLKPQH